MHLTVKQVIEMLQNHYSDPNETIVVTWWDKTDVAPNSGMPDLLTMEQSERLWNKVAPNLADQLNAEVSGINTLFQHELEMLIEEGVHNA